MGAIFVTLRAKPGCEEQLCAGVRTLVAATRQEPGNVRYDAYVSTADPAVVHFLEVWRDRAAQETHLQTPHYREFFELSKGLLGRRPDIDEATPL